MKKLLTFLLLTFSTFSFCSERQPYSGRADLSAPDDDISEELEAALAKRAWEVHQARRRSPEEEQARQAHWHRNFKTPAEMRRRRNAELQSGPQRLPQQSLSRREFPNITQRAQELAKQATLEKEAAHHTRQEARDERVQAYSVSQPQSHDPQEQEIDPEKFKKAITYKKLQSGDYQCSLCNEIISNCNGKNLPRHTKKHVGKTKKECQYCGKKLKWVKEHEAYCSQKTQKFSCSLCGEKFKRNYDLTRHMKLHNPHAQLFECEECGSKFKTKHRLEVHTAVHTSERPYECNLCGKAFKTHPPAIAHVKNVHKAEKPYPITNKKKEEKKAALRQRDLKYYKEHVLEPEEEEDQEPFLGVLGLFDEEDAMDVDQGDIASARPEDYPDDDDDDEYPFLEELDPL